jgi:FkbM family methyltransferase
MKRTRFSSRVAGRLAARVSALGYALSRRFSGLDPAGQSRRRMLAGCLPRPGATLVDVGANIGQFAGHAFAVCPQARVLSIDPIPENVEACRRTHGGRSGYEVVQVALGARSEPRITLHVHPFSQASGLLPVSGLARDRFRSLDHAARAVDVRMTTLDELLESRPHLRPIDLLKLDVEGYEVQVLRGAALSLARTRNLLVETQVQPMHEGAALFDEVCHLARSAGFAFRGVFGEIRDAYGDLLMLDLLFGRADGGGAGGAGGNAGPPPASAGR